MSFRVCNFTVIALAGILIGPRLDSFVQQSPSAENAADQRNQRCTISGNVVRAATNEPLRRARVVVRSDDDNSAVPFVAITDAQGEFTIEGIRAGRYSVSAEHDGYMRSSPGEDNRGRSAAILTLNPAQQITKLIFRLQRYAAISGRVFDEDEEPAEGVTVEAVQQVKFRGKINQYASGRAETDDLGEYRLFDLKPGRYFVRASPVAHSWRTVGGFQLPTSILKSAGGYAPTYYPDTTEISRASAIELKPGDDVSSVDLSLLRQITYKIRGQVVNAVSDRSGRDAQIELLPEDLGSFNTEDRRGTFADAETGGFEIDDVPTGRYAVVATRRDGENEFSGSTMVEVNDTSVESVRIVITRGAEIRGRVVLDGMIEFPRDLRVEIEPKYPSPLGTRRNAKMKPDGSFTINGVADGVYIFNVWALCEGCYVKAAKSNGADILNDGLQISSASAPSSIELVFSNKSGTIEGTVAVEDGSPASGATIIVVPDHAPPGQPWEHFEESTDQYGHFVVRAVPPGGYHAFAWKSIDRDDFDFTDPEFLKPFEKKAQAFSIGENEKKSLRLSLLPAPEARQ